MLSLLGYLRDGENNQSNTTSSSTSSSTTSSSSSSSSSGDSKRREGEKQGEEQGQGGGRGQGQGQSKEVEKGKKKVVQIQVEKRMVTYAEWAKRGQANPSDLVLTRDTVDRIRYGIRSTYMHTHH